MPKTVVIPKIPTVRMVALIVPNRPRAGKKKREVKQ
jgi:hypothetical protein